MPSRTMFGFRADLHRLLRGAKGRRCVAKVKTDGKGRFEVRLGPGQYVLESESAGLPLLKPVDVIVDAHEFTDVELAFDSGIR